MNCTKCDKEWPETTEYWETRWLERGLAGHACWCKECTKANDRKRYQTKHRWASHIINMKKRAKHVVNITPAYIESIWPTDNIDPLLGKPLVIGSGTLGDMSPTLHRIVPDKGYTIGNIAIVSHLGNRIMSNATAAQVQQVGKNMEFLQG